MSDENVINPPAEVEIAPRGEPTVMADAYVPEKEKERTFEGDDSTAAQKAADALTQARSERGAREQPDIVRQYRDVQTNERVPLEETVSAERASDDLVRQRAWEKKQADEAQAALLQFSVDAVRAGHDPTQLAQQILQQEAEQPAQPDQAAQPEQAQQPIEPQPTTEPTIDPEIADALAKSPKLRQALEQESERVRQIHATAQQAQQEFLQAADQAKQFAVQSMLASFPELQGIPVDALPGALQVLQARDPQRHAAAIQHLSRIDQLSKNHQQAQAQQAQVVQHQTQQWARAQDAEVDSYLAKNENPEVVKSVKSNLPKVLQSFGVSVDDFSRALSQTPLLRSAPFQLMLYSLAKQHTLTQQVAEKADRSPPPAPMRPGVSRPPGSGDDSELAAAKARMLKNPDDPKAAAQWLTLLRNSK
jgi:hypothetical protein